MLRLPLLVSANCWRPKPKRRRRHRARLWHPPRSELPKRPLNRTLAKSPRTTHPILTTHSLLTTTWPRAKGPLGAGFRPTVLFKTLRSFTRW